MLSDALFIRKWDVLSRDQKVQALGTAIGEHLGKVLAREYQDGGLGQSVQDIVAKEASKLLEPLMPVLGQKFMEVAEPAARKAADVVGPVMKRELNAQVPKMAAITGVVAGLLVVAGMVLMRKFG